MTKPLDTLAQQFDVGFDVAGRAGTWYALSRKLMAELRIAEAMLAIERACALDPRHLQARSLRKAILAEIHAMPSDIAALDLAAALEPTAAKNQLELAFALADHDDSTGAERAFKRAIELDRGLADAYAGLGSLYLRREDEDQAQQLAQIALDLSPCHPVASQTLSSILDKRGDHAEAEAILDRAYGARSLFFEPAKQSRMTVLVLVTRSQGNIPYRHLMPPSQYTRLVWYMEHAHQSAADLPDYDVIFNAIGDPDIAAATRGPVFKFRTETDGRFLNEPGQVELTQRHRLAELLGEDEQVLLPATIRLTKIDVKETGLEAAIERTGMNLPVLVRPIGSHGGAGLVRVDTRAELLALTEQIQGKDIYVTAYVDYRSDDNYCRKGRIIFVDRKPYPYHWAISEHWMVHYDTADMDRQEAMRSEEARFLKDPGEVIGAKALQAIDNIGVKLDLDYCGIDFSVMPDGRLLVFEANPAMLVHPEPEGSLFAYKNVAVRNIIKAFQAHLERKDVQASAVLSTTEE